MQEFEKDSFEQRLDPSNMAYIDFYEFNKFAAEFEIDFFGEKVQPNYASIKSIMNQETYKEYILSE